MTKKQEEKSYKKMSDEDVDDLKRQLNNPQHES